MITLLEPMDGGKPTHYIINNTSEATLNTTYNKLEDWKEAIILESILYGKENIVSGHIIELNTVILINELDVCGGESKINKDRIIL